jgi:hypothetical protein
MYYLTEKNSSLNKIIINHTIRTVLQTYIYIYMVSLNDVFHKSDLQHVYQPVGRDGRQGGTWGIKRNN